MAANAPEAMIPELIGMIEKSVGEIAKRQGQFLDSMVVWLSIHGLIDGPEEIQLKLIPFSPIASPTDNTPLITTLIHLEVHARDHRYGAFRALLATRDGKPAIDYKYDVPPTFALIRE